MEAEKGSLIADVGCGNGKYLNINGSCYTIGSDRSERLIDLCAKQHYEVLIGDNLRLPFKNDCFVREKPFLTPS
jgi:SAM-dependent methyltransferase